MVCAWLTLCSCPAAEVYDKHLLSTLQIRTLQSVTDAALDEAGDDLKDWKLLEPNCRLRGLPKLMQAWKVGVLGSVAVLVGCCKQAAHCVSWLNVHRVT